MKQKQWIRRVGLLSLMTGAFGLLTAQQKAPVKEDFQGQTYLSDQQTGSGKISVAQFKELIKQAIWVKDKNGHFLPVRSFSYTYAERGLFEDATGQAFISTDYISSRCNDRLDSGMARDMHYRAKPGDTAYIEHVSYMAPLANGDSIPAVAHGIKLILTP